MKIRVIEKTDFKDWLYLRKNLWPEYSLGELEAEMMQIFAKRDQSPVFVAENEEGGISGFIEVSIREKIPGLKSRKIGYVEGWYVKPEYRKMGIGRQLISRAESWAAGHGCRVMASDTNEKYPLGPLAHLSVGYSRAYHDLAFSKSLKITEETTENRESLKEASLSSPV